MTLNEVQILRMEELNRHISDQTRLLFGVAVDPALGPKMTVTILSAVTGEVPATPAVPVAPAMPLVEARPRLAARVESPPIFVAPTPVTHKALPSPSPSSPHASWNPSARSNRNAPSQQEPEPEPEP